MSPFDLALGLRMEGRAGHMTTAQLGKGVITAQALQHDPYLLIC